MNSDTYVIVPVYNEAEILSRVIGPLLEQFKHVICINDGSRDDSARIIKKSKAVLINHPINLGQGAAIQTGIEYSLQDPKAQYFITFDADGQHNIKDALRLLNCLKKYKLDIVLGSRFLGKAKNISLAKKTFLKSATKFSTWATGIKLTDTHVGLRVFNRNFAQNLNLTMNDMAHASEIINRIKTHKFKYREVPITITYSEYSKAKGQPMLNSVNIAIDLLIKRVTKW